MIAIGSTSVQVIVPYNELHNLSIVASLCDNKDISIHRLFYGKLHKTYTTVHYWSWYAWIIYHSIIARCDHPLSQLTNGATEVQVSGYGDLAIAGTVVNFSCLSGLPDKILTGPISSTCTGNGEWEPDPIYVMCKGNWKINFDYCVISLTIRMQQNVASLLRMVTSVLIIIQHWKAHYYNSHVTIEYLLQNAKVMVIGIQIHTTHVQQLHQLLNVITDSEVLSIIHWIRSSYETALQPSTASDSITQLVTIIDAVTCGNRLDAL